MKEFGIVIKLENGRDLFTTVNGETEWHALEVARNKFSEWQPDRTKFDLGVKCLSKQVQGEQLTIEGFGQHTVICDKVIKDGKMRLIPNERNPKRGIIAEIKKDTGKALLLTWIEAGTNKTRKIWLPRKALMVSKVYNDWFTLKRWFKENNATHRAETIESEIFSH